MGGADGVFAGVLDVYGDAGEVFDHDLGGEAGVARGAAGGDDDAAGGVEPGRGGGEGFGAQTGGGYILGEGVFEGAGLLVDLAVHGVGVDSGLGHGVSLR